MNRREPLLRRASADPRLLAGGAVALLGIGAATWAYFSSGASSPRGVEKPRVVRADGSAAPEVREEMSELDSEAAARARADADILRETFNESRTFTPVKNEQDVSEVFDTLHQNVVVASADLAGDVQGPSSMRERIAEDARLALEAVFSENSDAFVGAITSLGGDTGEGEGQHPLHRLLADFAGLGEIDLDGIRVSPYRDERERLLNPEMGGMGIEAGQRVMNFAPESEADEPMRMSIHDFMVVPASTYPEAHNVPDDAPLISVELPIRLDGSKSETADATLAVIMAWISQRGLWQPVSYKITTIDDEVARKFMASARAGAGGG